MLQIRTLTRLIFFSAMVNVSPAFATRVIITYMITLLTVFELLQRFNVFQYTLFPVHVKESSPIMELVTLHHKKVRVSNSKSVGLKKGFILFR